MGLHWHWLAYKMDVNLRWTSTFIKTNYEEMVPKQREKGGKQGSFIYNYIFDAFCVLKLLPSLQNFKNTSVGVLFLIKLQVSAFHENSKSYFFTSFMVPFWAYAALCYIKTGISLGCPWRSTWAKYF